MQKEEQDKLLKAKEGHSESVDWLILQYKALVCKIARSYFLVSGGDSDDLIQEGTLGLLQAIREYQPQKGKSFMSYAALCINNKVKDAIRAQYRYKHKPLNDAITLSEQGEEIYPLDSNIPDPLSAYIDEEKRSNFYSRMESLLSPQQLIVLKLYLEGYSYKEISARLDITTKSVDNALSATKEKIRRAGKDFL